TWSRASSRAIAVPLHAAAPGSSTCINTENWRAPHAVAG
ncbi:hypothetical protein Pgy4_10073, partial [Pseudomonas savastanoi pv. glycinea str. race 4]